MTDDSVARGREAWSGVPRSTSFENWRAICLALVIGREDAFRKTGCNAPHGTRYAKAFTAWVQANGFASMPFGIRASCLKLADHLEQIEQWRNDLPADSRASINHPQVCLRRWRKATGKGAKPKAEPRLTITIGRVAKNGRTISWPQPLVKRAADALRDACSNDYYVLAARALNAAVRTEQDIALLLDGKRGDGRASTAAVRLPAQTFPVINIAR